MANAKCKTCDQAADTGAYCGSYAFEDPILGDSALDRLANARYQIVIESSN